MSRTRRKASVTSMAAFSKCRGFRRFMLCAAVAALASGCSESTSSQKKYENTVSPYDREFNPDKPTGYSPDSVDTPESTLLDQAKESYDKGLYTVAKENW